jgi:hypothetical protein
VTAEPLGGCIALMALNTATEGLAMAQAHHLCEHSLSSRQRRMALAYSSQSQNASHSPR